VLEENCPAPHAAQTADPETDAYCPATHATIPFATGDGAVVVQLHLARFELPVFRRTAEVESITVNPIAAPRFELYANTWITLLPAWRLTGVV
jgi:hypothetical protein